MEINFAGELMPKLVWKNSEMFLMRYQKLASSFSMSRNNYLLIICALATLCFSHTALAQSGRRQNRNASSPAPPVTTQPTTDPATNPSIAKPPTPISSVIVIGDLVQSGSSYSNYVDEAVDACVEELKKLQVIEATGSGSRKRTAAMDRAKNETDAYVLWLEIKLVDRVVTDRSIYVEQSISCVDYYVFMPQTAKIMTEGRVYPGIQEIKRGGAVLRLPTRNKRALLTRELREIGRQVANRVRDKLRN